MTKEGVESSRDVMALLATAPKFDPQTVDGQQLV
jgi:hypothetical protein